MSLLTTRTQDSVLVIELNRADKGNALNRELQQALAQAWQTFEADPHLRVAVVSGASNVFSIGHDVAELAANPAVSPVPDDAMFPLHLSKPVIAAVDGPCYGLGFELALSCDLRVAGDGAMFGLADPHLYVPYRIATVLLPRMTFVGRSLELILAGRVLSARDMQSARLVTDVSAKGGACAQAIDTARLMAQRYATVQAFRKRPIWSLSGLPLPAAMNLARMPRA